jgi:hypothetical protein
MKKFLSLILLSILAFNTVQAQSNGEPFCASFDWGYTYSSRSYLFCGTSGNNVVESNRKKLDLVFFDKIDLPQKVPFLIYSTGKVDQSPTESIVVDSRDILSIGFSKKVIGRHHEILSSQQTKTIIQDNLNEDLLKKFLAKNSFKLIVRAKLPGTTSSIINIYVK